MLLAATSHPFRLSLWTEANQDSPTTLRTFAAAGTGHLLSPKERFT